MKTPKELAGNYLITFGNKYRGRFVKEIPRHELENYIKCLAMSYALDGSYMNSKMKELVEAFTAYYPKGKK